MKKFIYLFVLFTATSIAVSCNSDDDVGSDINDTALVGSWGATESDEDMVLKVTVTFNSNQTGRLIIETTFEGETETETENFTWSTSGNKLTIESSGEAPEVVTYSISGNSLSITDSDNFTTVFTRL